MAEKKEEKKKKEKQKVTIQYGNVKLMTISRPVKSSDKDKKRKGSAAAYGGSAAESASESSSFVGSTKTSGGASTTKSGTGSFFGRSDGGTKSQQSKNNTPTIESDSTDQGSLGGFRNANNSPRLHKFGNKGCIQLPTYIEHKRQADESSEEEDSESEEEDADATMFVHQGNRASLFQTMVKTRAEANSLIVADIILSDLETTCVEKSWAILTGDRQSADKGGMAELCDSVMQSMIKGSSSGKRLFESKNSLEVLRSFVSMINFIHFALVDFSRFSRNIFEIAVKHELYGVEPESFRIFGKLVSTAVPQVVGEIALEFGTLSVFQIENSWFSLVNQVTNILIATQVYTKVFFMKYMCHRSRTAGKKWSMKTGLVITIDIVYMFDTPRCEKLIAQIPIRDIMQLSNGFLGDKAPTAYGFELSLENDDIDFHICFNSKGEYEECKTFLDARIKDHERSNLHNL